MTLEQRRKTREALARYGSRGFRMTRDGCAWSQAIGQALEYYEQKDPIRARLMQVRYFEHQTVEQTKTRLNLADSTYQKANSDLLSTVAINAARYGLL